MKISILWSLLLALPLISSCQSNDPEDMPDNTVIPATPEPVRPLRVTASLPGPEQSRAHITYGNPDAEAGEIFKWNKGDYITLFNITRLDECPLGLELETDSIDGNKAVFESHNGLTSFDGNTLTIKKGDLLYINYGETKRKYLDATTFDPRNIFTIGLGAEEGKPQMIVNNPSDESLDFMSHNLKMYALVTATEDDAVPDVDFIHLSAIMRVSLRNMTGKDLYPTKLEFRYPGTATFLNTTLYCSVEPDGADWYTLRYYDTDDFYKGTPPYTDDIGTTINAKDDTVDIGETIKTGDTYELYLTAVPRLGNNATGKTFSIDLIVSHLTDTPYSKTIENFNVPILAGNRYWFSLTATPEGTLMFSKEWDDLQKANAGGGTE